MKKIWSFLETHYRAVGRSMYIPFIIGMIMFFNDIFPWLACALIGIPPLLITVLTRNIGTETRFDKIMKILNDK